MNASSRAGTRPLARYRGKREERRPGTASKRERTEKTERKVDCASETGWMGTAGTRAPPQDRTAKQQTKPSRRVQKEGEGGRERVSATESNKLLNSRPFLFVQMEPWEPATAPTARLRLSGTPLGDAPHGPCRLLGSRDCRKHLAMAGKKNSGLRCQTVKPLSRQSRVDWRRWRD